MRKMASSGKAAPCDAVELARGGEVAPEGLLDDHARLCRQPGPGQPLDHGRKQRRRYGQVMCRPARPAQGRLQCGEGRRVLVVAADVLQQGQQPLQRRPVRSGAVVLDALPGMGTQARDGPVRRGHADHRHVEHTAPAQGVQRREDLLVGQVAGGAEDDQGVGGGRSRGMVLVHFRPSHPVRRRASRRGRRIHGASRRARGWRSPPRRAS